MKYVITHTKPIRFTSNGKDKVYRVGEIVELDPTNPKTKRALSSFMIVPLIDRIDKREGS